VALGAATRDDRIAAVLAIDVKSDWTEDDEVLSRRSRDASQRVEPDRSTLVGRPARSVAPAVLGEAELEGLADRSLEPAEGGWRFRWDRRVLATEPVDPFAFLGAVRCPAHVLSGSLSAVMSPEQARRFAGAIPGGTHEVVDGAGHHVELDGPSLVAARILASTAP
jgi:pimeloyl-ACP methyl ester carboxylesterase